MSPLPTDHIAPEPVSPDPDTPAELTALLADPPSALQAILDDPGTPEAVKAVVRVAITLEQAQKASDKAAADAATESDRPNVVTNLGNPLAPVDTATHWVDPFMTARQAAEQAATAEPEAEPEAEPAPVAQVPPSPIVFAEPAPVAASAPTTDEAVQAMLDDPDVPDAMKDAIRGNLDAVKGVLGGLLASLTEKS